MGSGRQLLINPGYVGWKEAVQAMAANTWYTGSHGGFGCTAPWHMWTASGGHCTFEGRMQGGLTIRVDSACSVLLDDESLKALAVTPRPEHRRVRRG